MSEKRVSDILQPDQHSWFEETLVKNAPNIIGAFANIVVILADIRVYDVIYRLTGIWWQALSASFACAVPFLLWEIGWQYNHTTETWRKISLAMAGLAFATSIVLGVADYVGMTGAGWAEFLLGSVVVLTGVHTVVGFLYYYNDPDVARKRHKAQALAQMLDQETNAQVAGELLKSGKSLLGIIGELEGQYDPEDVAAVLRILQGQKKTEPSARRDRQQKPRPQSGSGQAVALASDTPAEKLTDGSPNAHRGGN